MSNKDLHPKPKKIPNLNKPKYNASNSLLLLRSASINIDQPDNLNLTGNLPTITRCEKLLNTSKISKKKSIKKFAEDLPDTLSEINEMRDRVPHLKHFNSANDLIDKPDYLSSDKLDLVSPKFIPKLSNSSAISVDKIKKKKILKKNESSVNLLVNNKLYLNDSKKENNNLKNILAPVNINTMSINAVSPNRNKKIKEIKDIEELKKNKYRTNIVKLKNKEIEKDKEIEKLKKLGEEREAEFQKEITRLKEIEKQKDDEYQKEIEKLKETGKLKEEEYQKELELQKEKEKQNEIEYQKKIESQKQLEQAKELKRQKEKKEMNKQKELEKQKEIEHQIEVKRNKEFEEQKDSERQKELNKKNEYEEQLETQRQKEIEELKETERKREIERQKEIELQKEKNHRKEIKYKSELEILQQLEKRKQLIHKKALEKLKEMEQKNGIEIQKEIEKHKLENDQVEKENEILKEKNKEEEKELEILKEKKLKEKQSNEFNTPIRKPKIKIKSDDISSLKGLYNKRIVNKIKYELQKDILSKEMLKKRKYIGIKYFSFSRSKKEMSPSPKSNKDKSKTNIFQDYKNSGINLRNKESLITKINGIFKKNSRSIKSIDNLLKDGINEENLKKLEDKYQNNYELINVINKYKNKKWFLEHYEKYLTPRSSNGSKFDSNKSNKILKTDNKKIYKINIVKKPLLKQKKNEQRNFVMRHSGSTGFLQCRDYFDLAPFYYLTKGIKLVKTKKNKYSSLSISPRANDNDILLSLRSNNDSTSNQLLSDEEIIKSKVTIYKDQVFKLFLKKLDNEKNNENKRNKLLKKVKDDIIKEKIEKKFALERAMINMKLNQEYMKLNVIVNGFERNLRNDCFKRNFSQSFD